MKKLRIASILLTAAMILGLMTGCIASQGNADPGTGSTPPADTGSSGAADPGTAEAKTITYASLWTESEPQALWLKSLGESYEAETGVKVEMTWVGRDVLNQVKTLILSGNAPDLVDQDQSELSGAFLTEKEQLVQPLDDLLQGPGPDGEATLASVFNEKYLDLYTFQGKNYFIPYNFITSGFYYNKNLWKEVGAEAPRTWNDFLAAADQFKAAGYEFCAQDNDPMYNSYWYYWAVQRVMGAGKLLEAAQDKTGAAWDDPGYLKAAQMVQEISKAGKNIFQEGYEGSVWPAGQNDFALGNQATILCGTWIPVELKDMVDSNWDWGYFPFPTVEGGVGTEKDMEAYLIGFCIPNGAKNVEGAKDFLKYVSSEKNAQGLIDDALCMHARKGSSMPSVLQDVAGYLDNAENFHLSYDGVASKAAQWNADVFYPHANALFHGETTAEQFVANIKEASIAFYANK